jgi:hypothetical protein
MPPPPQAGGGSSTPRTAKNVNVRIPSGYSDLSEGCQEQFLKNKAERDARNLKADAEELALLQARRQKKYQRDQDPEAFPETMTELSSVAPPPPPTTPHPDGARVVQVYSNDVDGVVESVINAGHFIYTVAFPSPMVESLLPEALSAHFRFNDEKAVTGLTGLVHESIELKVEVDEEVSVASLILQLFAHL